MFGCNCCCVSTLIYGVGLFVVLTKIFKVVMKFINKNKPVELQVKEYKKDVVYLVQFQGNDKVSSLSPFCAKVEAYLRLHEIPFERVNTFSARGRNGKLPMIELNGEQIADSHLIEFSDARTAATAHAVDRFVDNHTCKLVVYNKASHMAPVIAEMLPEKVPPFLRPIIASLLGSISKCMILKRLNDSGKFSDAEYNELLRNDLIQLKAILGEQKFFFGDKPTVVDCTAFAQIATVFYVVPKNACYLSELLNSEEFKPLLDWLERTKETIFKDQFHI